MNSDPDEYSARLDVLPEDRKVPKPEDYVGTTISEDGGTWRVDGIEAIGSKFVVFRLINLKTGQVDRVLKVLHCHFDPATPLAEAMFGAMNDLRRNPDRVIRICDRLLALRPTCEAAAFNKGVALLSKNQAGPAEAAFALAAKLVPGDPLNFVHQAVCLARLERDAEVLSLLTAANAARPGVVKKALLMVPLHAKSIRLALQRLVDRTQNKQAQDALQTCFGLSMRLRLLFWRFYRTSSGRIV